LERRFDLEFKASLGYKAGCYFTKIERKRRERERERGKEEKMEGEREGGRPSIFCCDTLMKTQSLSAYYDFT
jgi:hypothetical protein